MKLRFIGKDGSMGLRHGAIYSVMVYGSKEFIWVEWNEGACPYSSPKGFAENWEDA